ncbi:MAG: M23 family metallopeptidase [Oscillospiraceae bacterium]
MNKHNKLSVLLKGKGFYTVVAVVIIGAALASYFAINNMMNTLSAKPNSIMEEKQWGLEDTEVERKQDDIPKPSVISSQAQNVSPSQDASSKQSTAQNASPAQPTPQTASYVPPMSSQVTTAFSGDELCFNETMSDWRTHNGQDYKGNLNDFVSAPMDAEITAIYDDALWGRVVELKNSEITVKLMGLNNKDVVQVGAAVQQGSTVGALGEIPSEAKDGIHLHVEVLKDNVLQNPADYFNK